jgi:hypothetical protein
MKKSITHSVGAKAPPPFSCAPEEATGNAGNTVPKIFS